MTTYLSRLERRHAEEAKKQNKNFRTWKAGKGWLYASSLLVAIVTVGGLGSAVVYASAPTNLAVTSSTASAATISSVASSATSVSTVSATITPTSALPTSLPRTEWTQPLVSSANAYAVSAASAAASAVALFAEIQNVSAAYTSGAPLNDFLATVVGLANNVNGEASGNASLAAVAAESAVDDAANGRMPDTLTDVYDASLQASNAANQVATLQYFLTEATSYVLVSSVPVSDYATAASSYYASVSALSAAATTIVDSIQSQASAALGFGAPTATTPVDPLATGTLAYWTLPAISDFATHASTALIDGINGASTAVINASDAAGWTGTPLSSTAAYMFMLEASLNASYAASRAASLTMFSAAAVDVESYSPYGVLNSLVSNPLNSSVASYVSTASTTNSVASSANSLTSSYANKYPTNTSLNSLAVVASNAYATASSADSLAISVAAFGSGENNIYLTNSAAWLTASLAGDTVTASSLMNVAMYAYGSAMSAAFMASYYAGIGSSVAVVAVSAASDAFVLAENPAVVSPMVTAPVLDTGTVGLPISVAGATISDPDNLGSGVISSIKVTGPVGSKFDVTDVTAAGNFVPDLAGTYTVMYYYNYTDPVTGSQTASISTTVQVNPASTAFTVTFNANGGSGTMADQTTDTSGNVILAANTFTNSGYTFAGWATSATGAAVYTDGATVTGLTVNTTLYAVWTQNPVVTYTVAFNSNGGSAVTDQTVNSGAMVAQPTNPTRTGYTFAGWFSDAALTTAYSFSTPVTANLALYAKWTENPVGSFSVTFESNGGSNISSQTVTGNGTVTEPAAPTKSGYTFAGWFSDVALTTAYNFSTPVTSDLTLYAKWTENPVNPTNPTHPTLPTNPTSPTNPTGPTNPTHPTAPTSPSNPSAPATPTSPMHPSAPAHNATGTLPATGDTSEVSFMYLGFAAFAMAGMVYGVKRKYEVVYKKAK